MDARELSQSELARRVGLTQATVYRLLSGKAYGTTHLHKIARELGTTPAYLNGETDDPEAEAPDVPELTSEQREVLQYFDVLPPATKRTVMDLLRSLAGAAVAEPKSFGGAGGGAATLHTPTMEYHGE